MKRPRDAFGEHVLLGEVRAELGANAFDRTLGADLLGLLRVMMYVGGMLVCREPTPSVMGGTALALDGAIGGWQRGVKDYAGFEPTILRLVESIVSRRRCLVEYRAPRQTAPKRFPYDPYRLLSVHGSVYAVGKVPAYRNLATLAVDRILAVELTDEPFEPDAAFDPKRHEAEAFGIVWERPMRIVLRFQAEQAPLASAT